MISQSIWTSYGFWGATRLVLEVIATKLAFPGARLIRRPASIRGRRWIDFGMHLTTGRGLRIDALGSRGETRKLIRFGKDVHINDYVHIGAIDSVEIGDRVLIGSKVLITDHNHGCYGGGERKHADPRMPPSSRELYSAPVTIEEDVWIGEFVSILPGVRIGRGTVIGTMSTVSHDVPPYCIAAGSPARILKRYNFDTHTWDRA